MNSLPVGLLNTTDYINHTLLIWIKKWKNNMKKTEERQENSLHQNCSTLWSTFKLVSNFIIKENNMSTYIYSISLSTHTLFYSPNHIHIHTHTCTHTHTHARARAHTHTHTHTQTPAHALTFGVLWERTAGSSWAQCPRVESDGLCHLTGWSLPKASWDVGMSSLHCCPQPLHNWPWQLIWTNTWIDRLSPATDMFSEAGYCFPQCFSEVIWMHRTFFS